MDNEVDEMMTGGASEHCYSKLACKTVLVVIVVIVTLMILKWIVTVLTAPRFPILSAVLSDATPSFITGDMAKGHSETLKSIGM